MTNKDIEIGKTNAVISYFTIIGVIIAYYLNNEEGKQSKFASFHIRQSMGLWLSYLALGYIIGGFDSWWVTSAFYLCFAVLFIFGFSNAISKKTQAVPLVGEFYQKTFKNLGKS